MTDNRFRLTRRKALAGLGTIGAAGAGAGLGTTALFSDEESFENNSIQAGTTNLRVQAVVANNNIDGNGSITLSEGGTDQTVTPSGGVEQDGDSPTVNITVSDIKPGDSFILGIDVIVENNPMYVAIDAHDLSDSENTPNPEPEPDGGPDNSGSPDDIGGQNDLGDLDNELLLTDFGYLSSNPNAGIETGVTQGDITPDEGYSTDMTIPFSSGFLALLADPTSKFFVYAGTQTSPRYPTVDVPYGHDSFDPGLGFPQSAKPTAIGSGSNADTTNVTHYWRFELPADVGNVVQGDSVSFDLQWHAEQVRNNTIDSESNKSDIVDGSA